MEKSLNEEHSQIKHPGIAGIADKIADLFSHSQPSGKRLGLSKLYSKQQISELVDSFPHMLQEDITSGIGEQLFSVLNAKNHISTNKFFEAKHNKEKKEELVEELLNDPEALETILLYIYNRNFWNTHIKDGNKINDLRPHYPGEVKQKRLDFGKWKNFGVLEKPITKYGRKINTLAKNVFGTGVQDIIERYYEPHLLEMPAEEEKMIEDILLGLEKGEKNFIILNHDTFANIPLAILKFMKKAEELGIKDVNRYFTTIIGPLLNVHQVQNTTLNTLSNVVITHPAGNNIPEAKPLISLQQKGAISQIMKDLKEGGEGMVYFCSPSGTRDVVVYGENDKGEKIPKIYLPDESWGSNVSSIKMVNKLKKNNPHLKIYALSTNTTNLKKGISLTDNSWNKGAEISMHIASLNQEEPLETEDVLTTLTQGITYHEGGNEDGEGRGEKHCGILVPEDVFRRLKKRGKDNSYPYGLFNKDGSLNEWILSNVMQNGF